MPKLWTETIEEHRREVRAAVVETTAALVARDGLRSVTMSQIAGESGIGRATLYKYFPDVEAILLAWHEDHIAGHFRRLAELAHQPGEPMARIAAVFEAYAFIQHRHQGGDIETLLHRGEHVARARQHLKSLIEHLLTEAKIRRDVPPDELATYCLSALGAAAGLRSKAAVRRLVKVTLAGLRR